MGNNPVNFVDPTGHTAVGSIGIWLGEEAAGSSIARLIGFASGMAAAGPAITFLDVLLEPTPTYAHPCEYTGGPSCFGEETVYEQGTPPSPEGGRIIVDPEGNALIEPEGGTTVGTPSGDWIETRYPNESPAQQKHQGHPKGYDTPHGHSFEEGPGRNQRGPSLSPEGDIVSPDSPDAHWPIHWRGAQIWKE